MQASLLQTLGILDCAVFIKNQDNTFNLIHSNETWMPSIFPDVQVENIISTLDSSAYLADFLFDADEFWQRGIEGRINSGIWSEQIEDNVWRLEASAITQDKSHYLVLVNLENEYNSRQSTLQLARELLITNDEILEQHDLIYKRIESLAYSAIGQADLQPPIKELMDHTEFGIAIIDKNMQPLEQNSALFHLLDIKKDASTQPINQLLDLCNRQFPEFRRILDTVEKWNGEIYWMKADKLSRWLHLSICPVKDENLNLNYWLFLLTDVSRVKYLQQSNEKLTYFDVMTNLPNRQYFLHQLENAIEKKSPFFLLQINIKHIKRVNEIYGYSTGDKVVKEVVARLSTSLEDSATLARLGGNEFAVILHQSDAEKCKRVAMSLIDIVRAPINIINQQTCNVGLGIGVTQYPLDTHKPEELIRYADLAACFGKKQESDNIHFYSYDLKENFQKRIEIEQALRSAIAKNEFELYLQPIYNLDTGKVAKAEALIRWNRKNIGLVPPDEFIQIAEQTGMIINIGYWVISEAIRLLETLHTLNKHITVSVNLSPIQVKDHRLLNLIKEKITRSSVDVSSFLELELTEGVLVDDFEKVQIFLKEVRMLGITVAIDDFGTGYSSLSYLQKLPIDHLKIDRSFIQNLTTHEGNTESNSAIVLAIMAMAKSLKLGVIAEGVETELQQQFLKDNNCQSAQGYFFSKPVPFEEFIELSKTWYI